MISFITKNVRMVSNFLRGLNDPHKKCRPKRGLLESKLKPQFNSRNNRRNIFFKKKINYLDLANAI